MFSRLLTLVFALALSGCIASGDIVKSVSVEIPPQEIDSGGIFGQLLNLAGYNFSISTVSLGTAADLRDTDELTIETMAVRTILAGDPDRAREALIDPALVEQCRPGQLPISWLYTLKIYVQRQGQPETARVLAQYTMPQAQRDRDDVCGFFLETDETVNLKDFLPEYETRVEATGRPPRQNTTIGGFLEALYIGHVDVPYQQQ